MLPISQRRASLFELLAHGQAPRRSFPFAKLAHHSHGCGGAVRVVFQRLAKSVQDRFRLVALGLELSQRRSDSIESPTCLEVFDSSVCPIQHFTGRLVVTRETWLYRHAHVPLPVVVRA